MRAPFIVIEGLDRSGKSTQAAILHSRLQQSGKRVELIKFPDRTTAIGKMIDSYLRSKSDLDDHVIHLLFSANRWELASTIEKHLLSGTTVLCDRYAFSGIAFSTSKQAPGISYEWCRAPDVGLPAPDLTLFMDITPEGAMARGGYGEERYEKEDMQKRVREVFGRIKTEMSGQGDEVNHACDWIVLDAGRSREVVSEEVWGLVKDLVCDGVVGPIAKLWENDGVGI